GRARGRLAAHADGTGAHGAHCCSRDRDHDYELGDVHGVHLLAAVRRQDDAAPRPRSVAAGRQPRLEHEDCDQRAQRLSVHARRDPQSASAGGDMKREITPRAIALVLVGVAVVLGAAGWFLLVSPKRSQASKLAATIQTKQSQVSTGTHQSSTVAGTAPAKALGEALPDAAGMPDV